MIVVLILFLIPSHLDNTHLSNATFRSKFYKNRLPIQKISVILSLVGIKVILFFITQINTFIANSQITR